jgi:hypothetical protein
LGIVEPSDNAPLGLLVAASLHEVDEYGKLVVRCCNLTGEPIEVKAGQLLARFSPVDRWQEIAEQPPNDGAGINTSVEIPSHVEDLFLSASQVCQDDKEKRHIAAVLCRYADVFSTGENDRELTSLTEHSIPTKPDANPVRHVPRRLGPEKEAEVDRQVTKLLEDGLIEPGHGAWSSPVVLVRKKDNS